MDRLEKLYVRKELNQIRQNLHDVQILTDFDATLEESEDNIEYNKLLLITGCKKFDDAEEFNECINRHINRDISRAHNKIDELRQDIIGFGYDPDFPVWQSDEVSYREELIRLEEKRKKDEEEYLESRRNL